MSLVDREEVCGALAAAHFFLEARVGAGEFNVHAGLGAADEAAEEGLGKEGGRKGMSVRVGKGGGGGERGSADDGLD